MLRTYRNRTFKDETITADGCEFIECHFERSKLVYSGGEPFIIIGCGAVDLEFEGPAQNTLDTLRALHHFGGAAAVEGIIASIRNPLGESHH